MSKGELRIRLAVVVGTIVAAIILVAPTAIYFRLDKEQTAAVRKRAEAFKLLIP